MLPLLLVSLVPLLLLMRKGVTVLLLLQLLLLLLACQAAFGAQPGLQLLLLPVDWVASLAGLRSYRDSTSEIKVEN